jgi:hypothetical protein
MGNMSMVADCIAVNSRATRNRASRGVIRATAINNSVNKGVTNGVIY